ncbi:MAG: tRNA (guanosine(37)-N1)-methyltransferase TrmD [Christensenella sp.]|nr:tRNA (guanosine(37)-N1)-methyltransferase TrmD [Christensenella sp.]
MRIEVLTLFPEMFNSLNVGILKKAQDNGLFSVNVTNIRDYSLDKHHKVDDTPFGGGAGMVMAPQPLHDAICSIDKEHVCRRIYLSPKGKTLSQSKVEELSKEKNLMFVCGNYEGIDQRVIDLDIDEELSIGDYVLTGGELPAMVTINAVVRYIDGVLGNSESVNEESFSNGLLEYPQYTHPQEFEGLKVPEVLLSGNHQNIAKWRYEKQLEITKERRPDLLK